MHASEEDVRHQLQVAWPGLRRMAPGVLFGILSGLSAVLLTGLSAYLITRAAEQPPILYLGLLVVGVRAFALSRAFFRYLERLSSHDAAFRTLGDLRVDAFSRLEPLAPARLGRRRRGDLLTRVVTDVDQMVDWPTRVVQPLVSSGTVIVLALAAIAYFSPAAAGVLVVALLVALLAGTAFSAAIGARAERHTAELRGWLADEVADLVNDLDVLVAFGAVEGQLERVRRADRELRRAALRTSAGAGAVSATLTLAGGAAVLAVLVMSIPQLVPAVPLGPGFSLSSGTVDGPVLAVLALVPLALFEIFAAVPLAWTARVRVMASARRLAEIAPPADHADLQEGEEMGRGSRTGVEMRSEVAAEVPDCAGQGAPALELERFAAWWPGEPAPVCAPVSVRLMPEENLLITGPSGVGKTALAYGLTGLVEHSGVCRIGGEDIRSLSGEMLRREVCLIEQDAHLFTGTLSANLSFAHPEGPQGVRDDELIEVLEAVGLWGWAAGRDGLETEVGMFGGLVSGGQAQRIAVARGLLSGAQILVLDEPTAHVDPALADSLLEELLGAARRCGSVVVLSHLPVPERLIQRRLSLSPECSQQVS